MKHLTPLLLLLAVLCPYGRAQHTFVPASDPGFAYVGRVSFADPAAPRFTYPGVQVFATFSGTSVAMKTKPGCGYFMVEIDSQPPFKVHAADGSTRVSIATDLPPGQHSLCLTYANEGLLLKPVFYGLYLDPQAALGPRPKLPRRRLEFIGNSVTCALGNEGSPADKRAPYAKQNAYYSYAAIAARQLHAQYQIVARSGIGIYRNCNGSPRGDRGTLPDLFPYTLFGTSGERWDFARYQPDVVCVNLGTNDTTSPSYDTERLTVAFKTFLATLRSHYPKAHLVLLTGPMLRGRRLADVQAAATQAVDDARLRGDSAVHRFDFTPDDGSLGYGIFKHPSVRRHEAMAAELVPFLKEITGWE